MEGFYLSLNQGVTEIKQKYKRDSKQVLNLTSEDYRAQLGNVPENFTLTKITLASQNSKSSEFSVLYEAGNVIAKYYSANALPSEAIFKSDIKEMLKIYEYLSYNENISTSRGQNESDEEAYSGFEELKKFRLHKRIERNSKLSRKAKEYHGYTCKACSMSFDKKYGKLGYQFIEAHHLTPISHLAGARIKLDVRNDFTVLCSNCHSMIHKLVDPSDLNLLIELIKENS